jgi:serine kinase of HPr protein (carbohydrate metabolism regulator)
MIRHAGLIARREGGAWRGVMIEGPSGAGKSDLALRALTLGFVLVADDRTLVFTSRGRLFGRAPPGLAGLIEIRGLGLVAQAALNFAEIVLLVRCVQSPGDIERLPEPAFETVRGALIPVLQIWPFEASAGAKLSRAFEQLGGSARKV